MDTGRDHGHDREDVRALPFREVGDEDVDDGVAFFAVVGKGRVEDSAHGGLGAVDPVLEDADGLVLGPLVGRGREGG